MLSLTIAASSVTANPTEILENYINGNENFLITLNLLKEQCQDPLTGELLDLINSISDDPVRLAFIASLTQNQ